MPKTFLTSISTFCNESLLSGQSNCKGFVSITIHGHVQTKNTTVYVVLQELYQDCLLETGPSRLGRRPRFRAKRKVLAKLYVFGDISLNKLGREEQKRAKQVGCHILANFDDWLILIASLVLCWFWNYSVVRDSRLWRSTLLKCERGSERCWPVASVVLCHRMWYHTPCHRYNNTDDEKYTTVMWMITSHCKLDFSYAR